MDTNDQLLVGWLKQFPFQWSFRVTFWPGLSESEARSCMHEWLGELRTEMGTTEFGYCAMPRMDKISMTFHCNILVMGLRDSDEGEAIEWMRRLPELAGNAMNIAFHAGQDGVRDVLKNVGPVLEFELPSRFEQMYRLRVPPVSRL